MNLKLEKNNTSTISFNSSNIKFWRGWQLWTLSFLFVGAAIASNEICVLAQIVPDVTLGSESSKVISTGAVDSIEGGATRGANLFHSFQEFNVEEGRAAYFSSPTGTRNIMTRVTGVNPSNILGMLGVRGGEANLFFINPNGIIFGPNASLSLRGSFIASTASSFEFADGKEFSSIEPQASPLLTINVPVGLQFGTKAGSILVQGNGQGIRKLSANSPLIDTSIGLHVDSAQTLSLLGGDVSLEGGTLKTAGGRIELGSVAPSSLVSLTSIAKGWSLGYESVQNFRDIQLSGQAVVDASGSGAGDIKVQGRQVILKNGSQIESSTLRSESGGALTVIASDSVKIAERFSALSTLVYPEATGSSGDLTIETGQLIIRDGAQISTGSFGTGSAGNLTVKALNLVELTGRAANAPAPSGLFTSVDLEAAGASGNLTIETGQLIVRDGATVFTGTYGAGNAGALTVKAFGSVELTGAVESRFGGSSSLSTLVGSGATGTGGNLTIETGQLIIRDGALVSSATFGSGAAGSLLVKAEDSIKLIGASGNGRFTSSLSARTRGTGNAGNLKLATRQLDIEGGGQISARSEGLGHTGIIQTNADSINLDNARITASSISGEGGNIFLQSRLLKLGNASSVTTDATAGSGNGGNINVDTDILAMFDGSSITTNAVAGNGGKIQINTQGFFRSPGSAIAASSQRGIDGIIQFNGTIINPSNGLLELPVQPIDPSTLIAQGCPTNVGEGSSFVATGRGGLPDSPYKPLKDRTVWVDLRPIKTKRSTHQSRTTTVPTPEAKNSVQDQPQSEALVEANSWTFNSKGEPVLIASVSSGNLDVPWLRSTACHGL